MEKEMHYPIKYAVLELKVDGGYAVNYKDITQGFIASKCYVVESNIKYYGSGTAKISYKVVFPFEDIQTFKDSIRYNYTHMGARNEPSYDAGGYPYPVNVVDELYDTYEEAKAAAEEKNENYRLKLLNDVLISNPEWKNWYQNLKNEFEKDLIVSHLYEEKILKETEDMNISNEDISIKSLKK